MLSEDSSKKVILLSLLVCLLLGALPRLIWPELGEVLFPDELRDYHHVVLLVEGKDFPVDGPTRWDYGRGAFPGGFWYYLMAIPYSISKHPAAGLVFQNILGTLSILMFFLLGRSMFGTKVAFWATLIYATSPWSILLGRKLWNPHVAPLFAFLYFYSTWKWFSQQKKWHLALMLPLAAILLQIHPIFLPLLVAIPLFVLIRGFKLIKAFPLTIGMLGVGLLYSPFIVSEVTQHFPVLKSLFTPPQIIKVNHFAPEALKAFLFPFVMTTPEISDYLRKGTVEFYGVWLPIVLLVTLGLIVSQFLAMKSVLPIKGNWREHLLNQEVRPIVFIVIFLALFIFINLARGAIAMPRYFIPIYPLLMFLSVYGSLTILPKAKHIAFQKWYHFRYLFLALVVSTGFALSMQYLYGWHRGLRYHNESKSTVRQYMLVGTWVTERLGQNDFVIEGEDTLIWKGDEDSIGDLTTILRDAFGIKEQPSSMNKHFRIWVSDPARPSLPPRNFLEQSIDYQNFGNLWIFQLL